MFIDTLELLRTLSVRMLVVDEGAQVLESVPSDQPAMDVSWLGPEIARRVPFRAEMPLLEGGWLHFRGAPMADGRCAIAIVPSSGLRQAFLTRLLTPSLWRLGRDGRIIEATDCLAEWLGTSADAMVGTHFSDWMTPQGVGQRFEAEFRTLGHGRKRAVVHRATSEILGGGSVDVIADVTEEHRTRARLAEEVERMKALAHTDALTGLPNRRAFESALDAAQRSLEPFALALIDVDDMKGINDTYGHMAGDHALVEIAKALARTVRDSDLVARIGGDEFAVILPQATRTTAERIGPRLRECLNVMVDEIGAVSASMGLIHRDDCADDMQRVADLALYADKMRHRGDPEPTKA
ncbi:GGDEF domain-containing protein [Fimbriimonas ginsengisoli]|uniref:Signal transduction response regulator n=1 Tax=Fimbriimonas ginsengisoli Gsoil 348 TaxID=661478 RepID=A0A068NTH6_FIMGI|nr:GGDEF domain-containing protein [Fimbriimonas ginsengisoli]AIE84919.1 signal transduction response regulator [Fimbriimonas ginsengisoli Gsoil 348]